MSSDSGSSISAGEDQQLAIDQRQQVLQAEQEGTQKRTFSNWINSQLSKHQQQSVVTDLYADFRNGHILLDLLEVLSNEVLPREKGKNLFQSRNNIESALTFLGKQSIKLINIHVEDIISGKPSIVLGLIWQIILHFHIEGLASILASPDDLQPVKCDTKKEASPTASPSPKRSARSRWKISAQKVLLHWAQEQCARVGSVNVKDFKSSWKNGQAFLAIIHSLRPDLIDMETFQVKSNEEKLREAFRIAEEELKIPRLLEPEDVNVSDPDEKSIMTYVAQFLQYSKNRTDPTGNTTDRVRKAIEWLNLEEQTLKKLFSEMKDETYTKKYQEILLFMRRFNEQKRIYMSDLAVETLQPEEQRLIKQSLENITFQIAAWKEQLDHSLPPPLDAIESWLSEVEDLMSQTLPESGGHHNTMSLLQALSISFKALMIHAAHHSKSLRSFQNVDDNGVILVPADKTEEMKTRMEKILASNFSVLVDYRFSAHCVLALLEEGWPKLKAWKGKYKSKEAVEFLLADYNEFVGEKQFMVHLENAFQKFKELHNQLLTTEEYSDDSEIAKQYKKIESKYETFVTSTQEVQPVLEKVQTCWIQFENNISLITVWLDEQHKMHPGHVPMEILSKWKSLHKSLNRDANFLIEKTNEKAASKLSHRLKSFNNRWTKYLKLYEEEMKEGMGSEAQDDQPDGSHAGDFAKQTEVSARTLRTYIQTLQKSTKTAESLKPCIEILSNLEKLEKLSESVNVWAEGAEQVLTTTHPQETPEETVRSNIQDFYENGIFHQEELAEAEMTVHAVAHLILTHRDLQRFSVDGLKRNIVQAHEKVQELVSRLGFALHPPEKHLLEKDIKINFERSKGDLETYITSAMALLGQRVAPEEFISQYEETVGKFSVRNLEKFLKAADQMRTISSDKEKLAVDKVSADLRHRWKIVHGELESYVSELKQLIQKQKYVDQSCRLKTQISKAVHQNGDSIPKDTETNGSTLEKQLQIYEAQKRDLELLLQRSREKLGAESPHEAQDVNELQSRHQELEVLQVQLKKSWRQLESTSQAMEKMLSGDQKANCSETMSALQSGMKEVTEEINIRIQSLLITINVLLPIEQDVSVLCESNLRSPVQEMEKFTVSSIGSVYQDLQEFQSSVEDQIQRCDDLESSADVIDSASPVDMQAVQSIVQDYKMQLGATSEAMMERETLLKDLESFLSSLRSTKWSIQAVAAVSEKDRTIILQKQRNIELQEQKVHRLRMEAKELDDRLVPAGIYLEDPEHGGETSCLKMVDGFFEKLEIAKQAVLQELRNLDTQDSEIPSLNGASYSHLSSDDDVPSGLNDCYQEEKMETFMASNINSVLQEIKEVKNTFENEIQHCDSLDLPSTETTLNQYKMELKATNELMRERETTLKALNNFLSSLKAAKASIVSESAVLVMERKTLLEKQRNLEELEKDIYRLGQEAEKLDDNLQVAEITLEDPEYGGVTSCQKMISMFFDKLENAQQAVLRDIQSLQESEALEILNNRQRALCKNIEDIQDQIDKIGLRDPTIHAVQQRIKSLMQLEKKLESFINEKTSISTAFLELVHTAHSKDICTPDECDILWEDAMQNITHSKEQCEAVIELLRKFQSYKKELTSLIQKAETLLPCQSSYIGKENLQETLKKVKAVKQEFDDHSEEVDEISSTCKKLQSQINQIKSFEESPFQTEANTIIDKWLDITEKLESYNENLKSAISAWNKIQHFLEDIEQWELRKKAFEASDLTREEILKFNIEVKNHEKHLEEISKLSREIQNLLQIDELPLELQVIQSNLQSKVTSLSKFASAKANLLEKSPISPVLSPPFTCSTDGELVQINAPLTGDTSREQCVNGGPETERGDECMDETQLGTRQQDSTALPSESQRIEYKTELQSNLYGVQQSEQLSTLHTRLSELKKRHENLNTELQPGQKEKRRQPDSFMLLLQDGQKLGVSLKELNAEIMAAGSDGSTQGQNSQLLEITQLYDGFMKELQDTVQMLESHIEEEHRYDSLSSALNNKMTSFYEELVNFTGSSRENAPCELKRQKLQELRNQYEGLQKDFSEVIRVAEGVKQSASSPQVVRIQEALDMLQCKMRGYLERLDYLKEAIELPPLVYKSKKKEPKKGTKKKTGHSIKSILEPSLQPLQLAEKHTVSPTAEPLVESEKAAVEPSVQPAVDLSAPASEPPVLTNVELLVQHSVQSTSELRNKPGTSCEEKLALDPVLKPAWMSTVQTTAKSSVQYGGESSVVPLVQPLAEHLTHPDSLSSALNTKMASFSKELLQFSVSSQENTAPELKRQKLQELRDQYEILQKDLAEVIRVAEGVKQSTSSPQVVQIQEALERHHCKMRGYLKQLDHLKEAIEQPPLVHKIKKKEPKKGTKKKTGHAAKSNLETSLQSSVQLIEKHNVLPTVEPSLESSGKAAVEPSVQPVVDLPEPAPEPPVHFDKLSVQPSVQSAGELWVTPRPSCEEKLVLDLALKPAQQPTLQTTAESSMYLEHSVQYEGGFSVVLPVESLVQPVAEHFTHPAAKPSMIPVAQSLLQPAPEPSVQPTVDLTLRPAEVISALPAGVPSVLPKTESSVQLEAELSIPPAARCIVQHSGEPFVQPDTMHLVQHTTELTLQPGTRSSVQPLEEHANLLDASVLDQSSEQSIFPVGEPSAEPDTMHSVQHTTELTVQPSARSSVQPSEEPFVPPDTSFSVQLTPGFTVQPGEGPSIHPLEEPADLLDANVFIQSDEQSMFPVVKRLLQPSPEPTVDPTMRPPEVASALTAEEPSMLPETKASVQLAAEPSVPPVARPSMQPSGEPFVPPKVSSSVQPAPEITDYVGERPSVQPSEEPSASLDARGLIQPTELSMFSGAKSSLQPTAEPSVQPAMDLTMRPQEVVSALPTGEPSVLLEIESSVQLAAESSVSPTARPTVQPSAEPFLPPDASTVQPEPEIIILPGARPSVQPSGQSYVLSNEISSVQPTRETTVQPDTRSSVPSLLEPSEVASVQPLVGPSMPTVIDSLVPPAVEHTLHLTVQPAERSSIQHEPEPSRQNMVGLSLQSAVELKEHNLVDPSGVVELATHSLAAPSEGALQAKIQAVKTSEQDADNHAAQVVAENVVHNVLVQAVQDPVVLKAQEAVEFTVQVKDQTHPHPEVSTLSDKPLCASPDQTPVQPSKSEITKERKGSKGKKKKKLIAALYTADKQTVNGVTSPPVEKTSILNHSEQDLSAEFVQKKINQDASDSLRDVAKIKALEESVKVTEEQREAIGQLQMHLNDCDSFRRQLETSLSDLPADDYESLRIFALLTTVEEKLRRAEMLSDDGGRVVILKEVEPMCDEIKSYTERLSKVAAKIPCTVKMEEKELDHFEDVVGLNAQDTQLVSKQLKSPTSREATAMLSVGFKEAVSALEEPLPHYTQFQKRMQEILSNISHAGGDSALPEKTLEKFASHIKNLCVWEDDKIESEQSPEGLHVVMLERGIESLKKNPPKLSVNELAQHIEEIEKLHNDISRTRSQESAVQKANGDSRGSELLLSKCEDLLNELTVLRTEKKTLCQVFKSFQDALCAARQAYQMLCKEKENLKVAPTESHISQLDKRKHFLDKVEKEKVTLHVLKAEQANIGYLGISSKDQDRIENEVSQIEDLWEQMEFNVCRECDRLNKEVEEFAVLKSKVDDVRSIIQVQQDLLDQPSPSPENVLNASLGLFAEMQAIKHLFNLLRSTCDLQMKRSWGVNERQDLENSLDSLQRELENLEERVKDRQLTRCQTPDAFLEQFPSLQPIYSSLLWVKKSQDKSSSENGIALLLGDVEWQTTTYKKVQKEILNRKSAVDSAIGESNHIAISFDGAMSEDFSTFLQQLQELYQEQIIQSTSRLQQLELGWEKRKALFSEIEKLKELLQCLEKEATPVKRGIFTEAELCAQLNCLKAKTTEMEEIEGLVLTLLRNSQSYHGELKSSEQLYLNDILRSLKSKARRIRRLEEKTFCYTKKLLSICNEFQERLTSLHRNLNALQPSEPKMQEEALKLDREVFVKKLPVQLSQNAVSSSKDHLSQILRYKDLFKDNRLHWDDLTIDDLQKKCLSFTERSGHSEHCGLEQGHYQELSQKIRTMVCSLQRESDTTAANFDVIAAQVACKKIKKISVLIAEALGWLHAEQAINVETLRDEQQSLTALAENMDQSYQALSQLVDDYYKSPKHSQHQVKQALHTLNKIVRELKEPFLNELDENELQERLLRLEALGEISKAEVQGVFSVSSLSSTDDLSKHLREVETTGQQIEKRLSEQIQITKETCDILQNMQKAIAMVAELFREYEEMLHRDHDFALSSPREKFKVLDSKEEEINVAIAKIQNIAHQLKPICSRENQRGLDDILKLISNKNHELAGIRERKQSTLASYEEKYQFFKNKKQKIQEGLEDMEVVIGDSFLQKPASYKAALEQWEKSKNMMAKIQSYEEELLELQLISRDLSASIDDQLLEKMVYSLWDRWMYLLGITRDMELYGNELKQEWKFISELLEREVILQDNCQEEILDWPEVSQRTPHLQNSLAEIERFEENVQMQQMQLSLLKRRIQNILGIPKSGSELVPVIKEIQDMQAKCKGLLHKAQVTKQEIEEELQEREALKDEISAVNKSARDVSSSLENMEITDFVDTKTSLEELLRLVGSEKEKAQVVMEKLQDRYAETVPEELRSYATQCQEFLHETEEKVRNEIDQCSPQNIMTKRVNEISAGLKNIEAQLTVKTENIFQAKELQKKVWDEVDSWHSKLHALESEVQDMAEEDPSLAQEWMDKVTEPLNYYQQVTYLAERRSANLNKAASKLEEYEDTLKSTKLWIQITDGLINTELKDCSAKVLNKHVNALMIALDDADGKLFLLDTISSELGELSVICETDEIVESLGEVKRQVKDIQQRILNVLPQIQYLTKEVGAIENEVKKMEKKVGSIRTILTSSDIDDMLPIEHHRHGQVILENIDSIRGTVADIEAYRPSLPLSASGVRSLCLFRRLGRLLREAEVLEKVTKEQNKLLEPIIGEMLELDQEQEKLKHISKNFTYETPNVKDRTEELRKLMDGLHQKKEGILLSQRRSVIDHLVRLQQEPEDQDLAALLSPVTDGVDHLSDEIHWNDPCILPSLAEEMEESSLTTEAEDKVTASEAVDLNVKAKEDASNYLISPVTLDQMTQEQLENAATESGSVKPEMILHDCRGKVTEVELWLQRVNLSLAESKQEPDMRQSLEQKLVDFQKTLQETEKKINSLLEGAGTDKQRPSSLLEEAESLSRKLKALKISLENLQAMLQVRPNAEQVKSTETAENKYPTGKPVPSQEIVESLQNRNAAGEGISGQIRPRGKFYLPEDITWSKWQYLQKELSHRSKATPLSPENKAEAEKEVKINLISRFTGRTIKPVPPEDSKQLLIRLQTLSEEADTSLPQESGMNLHSNLFVWMCSVSQWLQKVEEMLDTDISREEASSELAQYEKLSEDLNSLSEEMKMKMYSLLKHISHDGENVGVLAQCYNDIRNWLVQTRGVLSSRIKCMHEELEKHNNYQNDIRQLYDMLTKRKSVLQQLGNRSGCEAAEVLKESAAYETQLQNIERQLSVLSEKGEELSIPISSNQEIHKLQDVLDESWRILRVKQDESSGAVIAKSQVDSLLSGVTDLLSFGKEKILKSKDYKCASKEDLNSHIEEHKKFFNILGSQVLLLQALFSKNSTPTDCKQIAQTVHEADILNKEAGAHCIHMMAVMKEWDEFDSRYNDLYKKMEALESLVPTKSLVEESVERVNERLRQYQQIKLHLDENEPRLSWVLMPGKRLQPLVRCRDLDSQILRMEQQWSQLTQNVSHELHRLESLGSHLASYNRDSAELSAWLSSAYQKLNNFRTQSLDVSQDLDTTKDNLHRFFEFTIEMDGKSSLKTSVLSTGTQLLRLKEADPAMLKLSLAKYEEQWTEIIAALPPIQEKLQQQLIEKLPSLQAIQEVMDWMKNIEQSNAETVPTTTSDIRSRLQKYKTLRKQMSHKQCIVDFINQSLPQLSVGDVEGKRYQRTELAELLGTLNLQWNMMRGDLNKKIQHVEQTLESTSDQESKRQSVNNWLDAQQVRLNKLQRPSTLTAAESILAECLELEEQIKAKSNVLEELERSGPPAGDHGVFQQGLLTSENLMKKRNAFASQVADLKTSIHSSLRHWKTYNENYECVKKMLVKLLYVVCQAKRPISSLNCLEQNLTILQTTQEQAEQHEENWSKMRAALKSMEGLCSPSAIAILGQDCKEAESRWTPVNEELSSELQSAGLLLQLWEAYSDSYQNHTRDMEQLEGKCQQLLYAKLSEDKQADTLQQRIQDLQVLEQSLQALRAHNLQVSELADKVIRQNAAAADVIYSERQNASHRIDHLERSVSSKMAELKLLQKEVEAFKADLENLQSCVKSSADFVGHVCLSQKEKEERSEPIKKHLLELRERSADIEHLNEETFTLPLDDRSLMLLQNLNRSWEKTGEMALEDCREHRVNELDRNNFIQNYETWMQCVEKMENDLTMGTAGTYEVLKKQQAMYEKLQAEIAINEHILHAFVTKALSVLESEEEENRGEVILKLTSLKKKWQSVISLVQQRNRENTILLKQWRQFRVSKQRLENNLNGVQTALSSVSPQRCHSLINAEKLLYDFKEKERHLNRLQSVYNTMVENGKDLLAVVEPESKEALQCDVTRLQDLWQKTTLQLQAVLTHFNDTTLKREHFEQNVENRRKSLHGLKVRVDEPLPTLHEDLQRFRQTVKELEEALDEWGDGLKELDNMKAELSQYIIAEDGVVLKKQVEALHRQWEELCLRVSMRKQEIEDRLNAWNVFNEKNKELCDWLAQMESKVLQTSDVNIEEMIEKLQKDCMEEINLFSENKLHLKQIGDQLIIASNKARSTDIENKLNRVNDRWKHLFDVIGSRVKKLKETLVIIQQLDKNMSNLRTWLSRIESELSKPVIYSICDDQEINKKLEEQKDLQKDIELHSTGVSSVLSICERLLHDTDACANETECDSIQQTTRSLDKRWRNICTMSMERRLRIEETWRLWQKFLEDYSKFDDWLKEAEAMAASPDSSDVLYTKAKEEQKRFEAFQRQIHERLTHLELINKQYRRLARENRTDAASRLKQMVHEGNQSWDQLQRRVASILRRLKHFTSQREDFEGTRDCILVWLTEMDLQLTNVEHFSESDIEEKMQQLAGFKQEITLNTNKIDQLIVFGEQLIQKSEAMDAVIIEDELEEIHRYCQEVFGRVYRFHERLTSRGLNFEEERENSENDTDGEDSREIQNSSWHSSIPEVETSHQSLCHLMPPPLPHDRSGRETPVSVDSIPLEWDPTVDVGGSSMHENDEEGAYYNPLSGTSGLETPSWHSPEKHMAVVKPEYKQNETAQDLISATMGIKASIDASTNGQMSTSTPSRKADVRTSGTTHEQAEDQGFRGIYSSETHSGVIERWEIIQAQSLSNELSAKQNLQQWQQFNSDLDNISLWLEKTEAELDNAEKLKPSTSIQELEHKVKQFKDTLKAFDHYKALVLSANLSSKEFQQADDVESESLLSRLHEVNSRWDQACHKRDKWRESLQNDLNQCEEFHETSHQLLLWLTEAESRRLKYRVADRKGDPHALLECQRQLMQLEEQLQERQIQANSLQDMSSSLLESNVGGVYVEADERTHVIATKMKQLLKDVSRDLKTVQRALDDCTSDEVDSVTATNSQNTVGALQDTRNQEPAATVQETSKKRSFFYRVLRAALPLQLLLLLLLLLACMIPFSEEDYSCAQANNFARSFYPMLRYTNGPPPT
ncbi:nesprin-2 isoform X2 [Rana temporaria]|uniref:nesprin-2 isoform X2 n=1 Tax=Rana temporaria TaxID=8407 RepID=UPI001AADFBD9|nr:nesprin-2 isoform X2 [Rana temporaria]